MTIHHDRRDTNLADRLGEGTTLFLHLGQVSVIAEVKLSGQDPGVLWKLPFRVEITDFAKLVTRTVR